MQLLIEGQAALSQVESAGVRVDRLYLLHALDETAKLITRHEEEMRADPAYKLWRRRFGSDTSFTVNKQLAAIVFGELGYKRKQKLNAYAKDSDEEAEFEGIDHPLVKSYFAAAKLRKARNTYLIGIQRELVEHADGNWYVHPSYHMNTVATFRSSCSNPNFQNNPSRNKYIAEMIRRCYIARPGQQLMEADLGQIETRTPCFYSFDPALMAYNFDPSRDMHRDMAAQLFFLTEQQGKHKPIRQIAKNAYVFPTFYGSYYRQTAASMWEDLTLENVKLPDSDKTVIQHLAEHGITSRGACEAGLRPVPGTFEHHVAKVDEDFTRNRFRVNWEWKEKWFRDYQEKGGCRFLTGFIMVGPHAKNDITNYCIQGVSFHIPLWSLIKINRILRKHKFKTQVIGEVHDCINFDGPPEERDDVTDLTVRVMTRDVVKHWPWINVPLVVEPEACPVGGSWFDKMSLVRADAGWVPSDQKKWQASYGDWV